MAKIHESSELACFRKSLDALAKQIGALREHLEQLTGCPVEDVAKAKTQECGEPARHPLRERLFKIAIILVILATIVMVVIFEVSDAQSTHNTVGWSAYRIMLVAAAVAAAISFVVRAWGAKSLGWADTLEYAGLLLVIGSALSPHA